MSDLISRQAAIKWINEFANYENDVSCTYSKADIVKVLNELPSAERTGHWINGKCDQCGGHAPFWAMASTYYQSNFCPHCGCRMMGVEHDDISG